MSDDPKRVKVAITGRVQGVNFRSAIRDVADDHGLAGSARNLPDGTVEAVFQGPAGAVDEAVEFCRSGPPAASVEHLELTELDPVDHKGGFTIR